MAGNRRAAGEDTPLARLAARRGADGEAFLSAEEGEAGERLRADWTRGGLMPSVTQRWDSMPATGGGADGATDWSDHMLDCRRRVARALSAVGPELSGVLVDVCCFLKGTEEVERDRRWPARSAKMLLKAALGMLARHYGLVHRAADAPTASRLRSWRG